MPLKFKFEHFKQLNDTELVTTPEYEPFSDGSNPFVRRQVLMEIRPGNHKRIDIIADGQGLFLFCGGLYIFSCEANEGRTLNMVRELDEVDVIPLELLTRYNFEV